MNSQQLRKALLEIANLPMESSDWEGTARFNMAQEIARKALSKDRHAHPWMHVDDSLDHLIISRCDWIYPDGSNMEAGPLDEARYNAINRCDGSIVLHFYGAAGDAEHLRTMLTYKDAPP
jgi:hypothetical protein